MSTPTNKRYQQWYHRDFHGLSNKLSTLQRDFNLEVTAQIEAEQRRRQPRAKKHFAPLPTTWTQEVYAKLRKEYLVDYPGDRIAARLKMARELRTERLNTLATEVTFVPDDSCMCCVKTSSTNTYSTQTAPGTYAKNALLPYSAKLERLGFTVHTRYARRWYSPSSVGAFGYSAACSGGDYELWANCQPWMADAASRLITIEEALGDIPSTTNARVLMPFLDYSRFDKHMRGGYNKKEPA